MEVESTNHNIVLEKAVAFSVRIVNLWKYLTNKKREYDLSRQVKRSGTSIGANITEAIYASSKKDFIAKLYIANKESHETEYWLNVLAKTDFITDEEYRSLYSDNEELSRLITSIIKTSKENLNS